MASPAAPATAPLLAALTLLAACGEPAPQQAQRISLEEARHVPVEPPISPDTEGAVWAVSDSGQAIRFGLAGQPRWMSLECDLSETPALLRIVRHAPARPGQKALFPVIGNGMISRFKVEAALSEGEWRWEGALAASDPALDVFTGPRELQATLPGGGSLMMAGSRVPGEFVNWCRAGGQLLRAEAAEQAEADDAEPSAAPPER
jgi:hypothetical protein